jgi:DNA-binding PadR family transcriptional regulator
MIDDDGRVMPRTKSVLSPAEYAVLGLLRHRPAHGYDLQRQLTGRGGLGLVCPVEPAMVYAILKSLSGLELIDGEWDKSAYPPKAIYSVNDAGDNEFQRWLSKPVGRIREVRLDFLVKLYFLMHGSSEDRDRIAGLLEEQIEICDRYARGIEGELESVPEASFEAIALGSKLSAARLTGLWLMDCLKHLGGHQIGR